MSDGYRDRDKLCGGSYLNSDELEELKFLRSVSPYAYSIGSRSPRRQSRSPRPNKSDPSPTHPASSHEQKLSSAPEIAAWPVPNLDKPLANKPQPSVQIKPPPTIITTSLSPSTACNPGQQCGSSGRGRSGSRSPYASPLPSPIPTDSQSHYSDDSAKLLSMLKVVAASGCSGSVSPGGHARHESELRQKIQTLEETVAEYEKQKYSVMGTFRDYGERVAERERKLEAEYSGKIIALSEEVLGAKKDFETRMKSFQALQEQFEREKEQALEKLRQEHQKEIQILEQRFSQSQLLNLEQKYIIEIQRLEEERKSLRTEKERLGETFERKLRRAQSLYETELTAAKLLYTKELEALRDHEEALKEELAARQDEFHDRLQEIQHQAKHSKDEMNNCKNEVALLERKLRKKELEVQNISREMSNAKNETTEALKKMAEAKTDLEGVRKEYNDQKTEFDRKLKMLSVAEAARKKLESTIRELQIEVKSLKNKVEFLEMERDNLQSQTDSQSQLHNSQVQALEAVLESVTKEKETTKEHYERLLEREREQAEEREYSIKQEFSTKLNELEDQYNALREHIEQSDEFGPENVKLWEEIECLRSEKSVLEDEVTLLKNQLSSNHPLTSLPETVGGTELSLDYIIELLRAIDVVKKKVLQSGSNSRASENPEEYSSLVGKEEPDAFEDAEDNVQEVELETATSLKTPQKLEVAAIIKQLKDLESSVDEIIQEKNEAKSKVEQLGEENRILMEKLEYFKSFNNPSEQSFSQGEGSNSQLLSPLEEFKLKVKELEDKAKNTEEMHEKSLEEERKMLAESFEKKLIEEKEQMEKELGKQKNSPSSDIQEKLCQLEEEQKRLQEELESKDGVIESIRKEAEDRLRKQQEEKAMEMEQRIIDLNKEHEKTVELMREHQLAEKEEVQEDQTQTDFPTETSEVDESSSQLIALQQENEKKEEEIKRLKEELNKQKQLEQDKRAMAKDHSDVEEEEEEYAQGMPRKDRSQSMIGGSEHAAMCQKAASRFHNLVSQISEKHDTKSHIKLADSKLKSYRSTKDRLEPPTTSSWSPRGKSPSNYLSPLRESSPYNKLRLETQDHYSGSSSSTHRSLLSPSDIDDSNSRRGSRVSPSRYFFGKNPYDKSEKRPAWKF